ncbi:hypothetical protein B0H12DRAFT_1237005 [Mycena haematopus]|nr:hypothetical protein B0H12DRAFT_1237005 [Mycena haematopus]
MAEFPPYAFKAAHVHYQQHPGYAGGYQPGYAYAVDEYISPPHPPAVTSNSNPNPTNSNPNTNSNPTMAISPPTSLLWTDLEPWMDAEYARQVCALMRWEAGVVVPAAPHSINNAAGLSSNANPNSGGGANNAGYCVLTFASPAAAAAALAQVNSSTTAQMTMPNSARAFVLNWAPPGVGGVASPPSASTSTTTTAATGSTSHPTATTATTASTTAATTTPGSSTSSSQPQSNGIGTQREASTAEGGYASSSTGTSGVVSPTSPLFPGGVGGAGGSLRVFLGASTG